MASKFSNLDLKHLNDTFRKWISREGQKHLSILVTGKTGVGKSRLVNALVGKRVAEEGQQKTACTATVNSYRINDIEVFVWDSPGLQDGTCKEEFYFEEIRKNLHKGGLDVMIYCIKMEDRRFHEEDKNAFRALTREFGKDLWKNAVIALTFANKVEDPDEGDEVAYFQQDLNLWRDEINKFLAQELALDLTTRIAIPVVPAGNSRKPRLPNCKNWLSQLWISCYQRMSDSSRIALYRINLNRLKFAGSANIKAACIPEMQTGMTPVSDTRADTSQSADDQNNPEEIPLDEKQKDIFWKSTWEAFKSYSVSIGKGIGVAALGFGTLLMILGLKK